MGSKTTLSLFRSLLPSWKFFDDVGYIPRLYYRFSFGGQGFGYWNEWTPRYDRTLFSFFVNPEGNLTLAYVTLLENLMLEIKDAESAEAVSTSTSYRLVEEFVRQLIKDVQPRPMMFQFRLSVVHQAKPQAGATDILVSGEHEA